MISNNFNWRALTSVFILFMVSTFSYSEDLDSRPFSLNTKNITQGRLVIGQLKSGYQIALNGNKLAITPEGQFVFGFGRDQSGQIVLTTTADSNNRSANHQSADDQSTNKRSANKLEQGTAQSFSFEIQTRNWKTERINGLPESKVNPRSAKLINRIRKETKLVKKARANNSSRLDFTQEFIKPAEGRISGVYGSQRILNGVKKRPHFGQDIANKIGTPVIAPIDGVVTLAETDLFFSGGTIIIDHGFGVSTTYLHLSQINVKVGQTVSQKDKVGEIGATGRATGPHLDWRLNWNTTRLDPALLIKSR